MNLIGVIDGTHLRGIEFLILFSAGLYKEQMWCGLVWQYVANLDYY